MRAMLRSLSPTGPRVAEQRAERAALDAHVGAEQVLAVEVEEHAADRRFQERNAALVAGRGPRVFALAVVARQAPPRKAAAAPAM